jgi:hypothetical protein
VRVWLEEQYPVIAARARREGALILWLDQTGIRSDAAVGVTWAPRGQTPVVGKTGKRFSVNAMCAIGNKGELYFTVYTGSFNAGVFLPFLDRLVGHLDRKVHLIVDGHGVHRRKIVQQWIAEHAEAIEMHFLPGYSPELNPDEILNADPKRAVSTNAAPKTPDELEQAVRSFLHRLQKLPDRIRSYFAAADHKPQWISVSHGAKVFSFLDSLWSALRNCGATKGRPGWERPRDLALVGDFRFDAG